MVVVVSKWNSDESNIHSVQSHMCLLIWYDLESPRRFSIKHAQSCLDLLSRPSPRSRCSSSHSCMSAYPLCRKRRKGHAGRWVHYFLRIHYGCQQVMISRSGRAQSLPDLNIACDTCVSIPYRTSLHLLRTQGTLADIAQLASKKGGVRCEQSAKDGQQIQPYIQRVLGIWWTDCFQRLSHRLVPSRKWISL